MPFDAAPAVLSPLPANVAGQSALVLDMVEFYFRDGERWLSGTWQRGELRCLLGAVKFVRSEILCDRDQADLYLARAIAPAAPAYISTAIIHGRLIRALASSIIMKFNDRNGRTYAEIAAVLRTAKALAEIDARAFDEEEKRNAADDSDPIEVRVIDEALKNSRAGRREMDQGLRNRPAAQSLHDWRHQARASQAQGERRSYQAFRRACASPRRAHISYPGIQ